MPLGSIQLDEDEDEDNDDDDDVGMGTMYVGQTLHWPVFRSFGMIDGERLIFGLWQTGSG